MVEKAISNDLQASSVYQKIQSQYGEKPEKQREAKKTLDKDDFLKLMVAQMKNQDPTNPFKADQMATQMAQVTSVEQLQNVNQNLIKMAESHRPAERMSSVNLIGKFVTVDRQRFLHEGGQNELISFQLPSDCETIKIKIQDDSGEDVFQTELKSKSAGEVSYNWDGKQSDGTVALKGHYRYQVDAVDYRGRSVPVQSQKQARIIGVSFEGKDPIFLVGDGKNHEKVELQNLVKIEIEPEKKERGGDRL
jgi:flagellar basal-body rod modification protein FlgD